MDEREGRQFIRFLASELKNYTRELMAYQLLTATLKIRGQTGIDELLQEYRESPTLHKRLDEILRDLEEILPPEDADYSDQVKELLLKWKPSAGWQN